MSQENERTTQQRPEPFYVDGFRQEDAEGIVSLFRAVYGEGYPIQLFYDPEAIIAANQDGSYISVVARTDSGEVIGVTNLYRSAPFKSLYEWGAGLIAKEYRNWGIHSRLTDFLFSEFVPGNPDIEMLFGEPVCNHTHMQNSVVRFNFIETALEVALMPAAAYTQEKSAGGRVTTLSCFRSCKQKPHRIFLPLVYEAILRRIYGRLDDTRNISLADGNLPADKATRAELSVFDFARVARIAVHEAGSDFPSRLSELESEAKAKDLLVFQVWLNLTEPWVCETVEVLRDRGYFFGGALPRWFDGDGLLMQKLECPPDFENIALLADFSKELLGFIQEDWKLVNT